MLKMLEKMTSRFAILGWFLVIMLLMGVTELPGVFGQDAQGQVPLVWQMLGLALILLVIWSCYRLARCLALPLWSKAIWSWRSLGLVLLAFAIKSAVAFLGQYWLEHLGLADTANQAIINEQFTQMPILLTAQSALLAPIAEELMYRGLIQKKLFGTYPWLGLLVSSFIFAAMHVPTNLPSWFIYGSSGLIYGLLYMKTDKLVFPIALHMLNNAIKSIGRFI